MGDRCYVRLELGGRITEEQADRIEMIFVENGFYTETYPQPEQPHRPSATNTLFGADEVNYGDTDFITDYLGEQKIPYEKHNEAGGSFGEALERFDGETTRIAAANEGEAVVHYSRILEADALVSGWADLIAKARFWDTPMPPLEIVR